MTPARNAPCPCGSGKKYKRCCGADGGVAATDDAVQSAQPKSSRALPVVLFAAAIGVGVGVGTLREAVADGLAVSLALIMGVIIYLMARNPPEGTGTEGGTAINFGLSSRGRSRRRGPQNRRQRRQK